jgi:inorganic triphosphatase YgiF
MAEIELKFALPPEAHGRFRNLPELERAKAVHRRMLALYFDTPAHDLARHEMALRLRRSGRDWKQALKAGKSGEAGLHSRDEWEYDRTEASLDLSLFAATPLARLDGAAQLHERLGEVFRVDVARTTWEIEVAPGTRIEVALDAGAVRHGDATEAISEVEIESLEGPPQAVLDFALRLVEAVPLRPSAVTKAQRGYRLARGEKAQPVKAGKVRLHRSMSIAQAARAALASAIAHLQANEEGALATDDPEFVHQMRVALRRVRSALRAFRKASGPQLEAGVREDLHWITQATGKARDLDVLATQTLPELLAQYPGRDTAALKRRLAARRREARAGVRAALQSERYSRLMLCFARWLAQTERSPRGDKHLGRFAASILAKRDRRLERDGRGLAKARPPRRHEIRIAAKRLRYIADGFASLYRKKRVNAYLETLSALQESLGQANDAAVAQRLLAELSAPAPVAAFARGWLASRTRASLAEIEAHVKALAAAPRPWGKA